MTINITQKHMNNGLRNGGRVFNPIALAIVEAYELKPGSVWVGEGRVYVRGSFGTALVTHPIPLVKEFTQLWAAGQNVQPFQLELPFERS